ncbi:MAG: Flp pilus assembly protein CpaB [Planctomycetota bacterium]|nr:Flp pilus assembly protein CpaB [Planctomycetota bacterium]
MRNLTPAKLVVMMVVAMGLLVAVYVGKQLMAKEPPRVVDNTRTVPMAIADLAPGTVIKDEHIGMGRWPANEIVGDILLDKASIVGRVVRKPMTAAEPIHGNALFPMGELPPLTVSDGHRATTIHLTESAAVMSGLLRPGDHVDVQFTPTAGATSDPRYQKIGAMSVVLFKGVRLLAINRLFVQSDLAAGGNNVTLEIAESDVAILRLADENGDLYLSYNPIPNGTSTVTVANPDRPTLEELLQLPPIPEEPVAPQPNVYRSWVYSGSGGRMTTFVNGVPSYGNVGNYDYNGSVAPNQSTVAPNGVNGNGYPNGNNAGGGNPGFVPGAAPINGFNPAYGPQTSNTPIGIPSSRERGTPDSRYPGATQRTASAR